MTVTIAFVRQNYYQQWETPEADQYNFKWRRVLAPFGVEKSMNLDQENLSVDDLYQRIKVILSKWSQCKSDTVLKRNAKMCYDFINQKRNSYLVVQTSGHCYLTQIVSKIYWHPGADTGNPDHPGAWVRDVKFICQIPPGYLRKGGHRTASYCRLQNPDKPAYRDIVVLVKNYQDN